ncbi:MAG: ABC transporter ATP-binding protein [Alphaproteobacteria bacterium]|nr:ABC transporter ATP-binding protein [Alphaproteobacteria bacterium]
MSRIVVSDIVKDWGGTRAVDRIGFVAEAGRLLVLLGPSGCGKSTTLRLIAGLEEATAGRIEIGGRDVTRLPPAERRIAMVFQSYALFPHLSVAENIVFGLRVRRVDAAERARRLKRVAELVGLAGLLERKPAQLSGGQRQRVALGRAIIAEAPVCLMDEPLSNLDAQLRHEMRSEIRALQRRIGMTMIYVTHDQTEAMTMADHVILMREGRIEQQGTPEDLYTRPASAFAARFLGTPPMNLIALDSVRPHLPPVASEGALLLGVRPERVTLVASGVPALVEAVEYLGADTVIQCRIADQPFAARVPGHAPVGVGDRVALAWDAAEQHLFRKDGGARVESAPPERTGKRPAANAR